MIVALVGNGPSKSLFHRKPEYNLVCGFNFARDKYLDRIFISDPGVSKRMVLPNFKDTRIDIIEKEKKRVFKGAMNISKNTSQVAYMKLLREGAKEFHIFGHDLMWADDYTSESDKHSPKDAWVVKAKQNNLRSYWMKYWSEIITVPTYIHMPENQSLNFKSEFVNEVFYQQST